MGCHSVDSERVLGAGSTHEFNDSGREAASKKEGAHPPVLARISAGSHLYSERCLYSFCRSTRVFDSWTVLWLNKEIFLDSLHREIERKTNKRETGGMKGEIKIKLESGEKSKVKREVRNTEREIKLVRVGERETRRRGEEREREREREREKEREREREREREKRER